MEIEVVEWCPDLFNQNSKVAGCVKVLLNKKMFIWMTILRGRTKPFGKFPSIKSGDIYISAVGWPDNNKMERMISDEVIRILKQRNDL